MRLLAPVIGAFLGIFLVALGMFASRDAAGPIMTGSDGTLPPARYARQDGYVLAGRRRFSLADVRQALARYSRGARSRFFTWSVAGLDPATATAHGTGDAQYFVNSFLVGFRPFKVDSPTIPLAVLARRKTYTRDEVQYDGQPDVWQTSRESYIAPRGDCEDHALALADWLIEMGLDARVVLGTYRGGGHAWVVVIDDGGEYLLEATDKRTRRRPLPRAELARGYAPQYQFNREFFWVNTAHGNTRAYTGPQWERRSRFVHAGDRL